MIVNDYKTVVDVSKITEQSTRNVRRIINRIKDEVDNRQNVGKSYPGHSKSTNRGRTMGGQ